MNIQNQPLPGMPAEGKSLPKQKTIPQLVRQEINRAKRLHKTNSIHNPETPLVISIGILLEEFGEMLQHIHDPESPEFQTEAIQTIACLYGLIERGRPR
jgi:hypothetical protein